MTHIAAPACVKHKLFFVCKSGYLNNFLRKSCHYAVFRIVWILCKMGVDYLFVILLAPEDSRL